MHDTLHYLDGFYVDPELASVRHELGHTHTRLQAILDPLGITTPTWMWIGKGLSGHGPHSVLADGAMVMRTEDHSRYMIYRVGRMVEVDREKQSITYRSLKTKSVTDANPYWSEDYHLDMKQGIFTATLENTDAFPLRSETLSKYDSQRDGFYDDPLPPFFHAKNAGYHLVELSFMQGGKQKNLFLPLLPGASQKVLFDPETFEIQEVKSGKDTGFTFTWFADPAQSWSGIAEGLEKQFSNALTSFLNAAIPMAGLVDKDDLPSFSRWGLKARSSGYLEWQDIEGQEGILKGILTQDDPLDTIKAIASFDAYTARFIKEGEGSRGTSRKHIKDAFRLRSLQHNLIHMSGAKQATLSAAEMTNLLRKISTNQITCSDTITF